MRPVLASVSFLAVVWPGLAWGATDVPVQLEVSGCTSLNEVELRRIVAAELGTETAEQGGPGVTHVIVTCEGPRVRLRVEDPLSRKAVQRSIDLGKAEPRAHTRLVAIASTELVLASWAELETNPKPRVEPEGPRPDPKKLEAARGIAHEHLPGYEPRERHWYDAQTPKSRAFRLLAVGSTRSFFEYDGALWGGGLRLGEVPFRSITWSADVLVERGSLHNQGLSVRVTSFTAGWRLMGFLQAGHLTFGLGAGLRLGGAASSDTTTLAAWGWPLGAAAISLRIGRSVLVELSGEASYVVLPIAAGPNGTLRGTWFGGQLGVGWVSGP